MQKLVYLFLAMYFIFVPIAVANQDDAVEPFQWGKEQVNELKKTEIPVYIPSHVPAGVFLKQMGSLYISKLEANKNQYIFTISRKGKDLKPHGPLSFEVMTMSGGPLPASRKQALLTYEMFDKKEGFIKLNGFNVDSFNDRKVFIWKDQGWEYLVWANNPNSAINIMKRVMSIFPKGKNPVAGTTSGQFTTYESREGVFSDAGWTFDQGKTWYILTGKSTPEQNGEMLKSMVSVPYGKP